MDMPQEFAIGNIGGLPPDPSSLHFQWLRRTAQEMAEDHERIFGMLGSSRNRVQESGHEVEAAWAEFLSNWLPPTYEVGTRKYIVGEVDTGKPPAETDLVVFRPSYPKKLREKSQVLASGVAAAFSVKLTIRPDSIAEAVNDCAELQRSLAIRDTSMRKELLRQFPYGLLAHSHDWNQPGSRPSENVTRELYRRDIETCRHPKESLDLICVPNLGLWSKHTMFSPPMPEGFIDLSTFSPEEAAEVARKFYRPRLDSVHAHTNSDDGGQSIALFLAHLYALLAIGDDTITELARGFSRMGGSTSGKGPLREWDAEAVMTPGLIQGRPLIPGGPPNTEHAHTFGGAFMF